jgi:DNA-binding XRE family transcriptional regulator
MVNYIEITGEMISQDHSEFDPTVNDDSCEGPWKTRVSKRRNLLDQLNDQQKKELFLLEKQKKDKKNQLLSEIRADPMTSYLYDVHLEQTSYIRRLLNDKDRLRQCGLMNSTTKEIVKYVKNNWDHSRKPIVLESIHAADSTEEKQRSLTFGRIQHSRNESQRLSAVERRAEEGITEHKHFEKELVNKVRDERVSAGLKQKDMAQKFNIKESLYSDFESGRAIYDPALASKLKQWLAKTSDSSSSE